MRLIVQKLDNNIQEMTKPDIQVSLNNGTGELLLWGNIYLFKSQSFKDISKDTLSAYSFKDLIPLLTGQYVAALVNNNAIKSLAVDFYGHQSLFINKTKDNYFIAESILDFQLDSDYELDSFQLRHFIDKGYTWASGTFIKGLNKVSPTINYVFKDEGIEEEFIPFPTFITDGKLENVMADTLKALTSHNEKVGLFFSSGVDSTYIREVAYRNNIHIIPCMGYYESPVYFACEEDLFLTKILNKEREDIKVFNIKDVESLYEKTISTTISLLPFDFHDSLIMASIYPSVKSNGIDMMISGQNSDSVYALAATHHTPVKQTIKRLLSLHLHNSGLKSDFKRYVQTGRFLKKLQKGKAPWWVKLIWKKLNPDYDFTFENLLMAYIKEDCELPIICHDRNNKLEAEYISKYQAFVRELNVLFDRGETPRMVMIRGKLLGHCQGRDVRCLTEWAKNTGVKNMQVFTSGPILSWLGSNDLNWKDIFVGKRLLREYLEKTMRYSKLKAKVPNFRNAPNVVHTEPEMFERFYNYLNKDGNLEKDCQKANDLLYKNGIISNNEHSYYSLNKYSNEKFRLVWIARSLALIEKDED